MRVFVALDAAVHDFERTFGIVDELDAHGLPFGVKVNLDLILKHGYQPIMTLVQGRYKRRHPLFFDLKMWNGKRTMLDVLKPLVNDVEYVTVYALADTELKEALFSLCPEKLKVTGVTVLTHYDNAYCQKHFGRARKTVVQHLAFTAAASGCKAIVVPGDCLDFVKDIDVEKIVPAVREAGSARDDRHADVAQVTPEYAFHHGADVVVVGGPIMKSADPCAALRRILDHDPRMGL